MSKLNAPYYSNHTTQIPQNLVADTPYTDCSEDGTVQGFTISKIYSDLPPTYDMSDLYLREYLQRVQESLQQNSWYGILPVWQINTYGVKQNMRKLEKLLFSLLPSVSLLNIYLQLP